MMNPGVKVGFVLTLSRNKKGKIFVCEVVMLALTHPNGFSYVINMHRDISNEISVEHLLNAIFMDTLTGLIQSHEKFVKSHMPSGDIYLQAAMRSFHPTTKIILDNLASMVKQASEVQPEWPEETQPEGADDMIEKQKSPVCL